MFVLAHLRSKEPISEILEFGGIGDKTILDEHVNPFEVPKNLVRSWWAWTCMKIGLIYVKLWNFVAYLYIHVFIVS